jgi:hypothetical protein
MEYKEGGGWKMKMTIEEAKKKDCCSPAYLEATDTETGYCKADGCMAWRWGRAFETVFIDGELPPSDGLKYYFDSEKKKWWREVKRLEKGFCGLAGDPK